MTLPNCREDEAYNEDFLHKMDREFVKGYDWCVEQVENLLLHNLEVYAGRLEVETEIDVDKFLDKAKVEICMMVEDWCEKSRNELITSMIEGLDHEEYERLKAEGIERNSKRSEPKVYCNTRSWAYIQAH